MLCTRGRLRSVWRAFRTYSTKNDALVTLRPYQEACLQACTDALRSGVSRLGVSLPTGAGKTTVFMSLLPRILPPQDHPEAKRSLVIVNSIELAKQSASQAAKICPQCSIEIEQGSRHVASGTADITVATYQTLLQPNRLAKFDPKYLKAIIVDEAHHAAAPSYRRILSHFNPAVYNPDPTFVHPQIPRSIPILGFSATFSRHDGLALGSVFERIVYHRDFLEMIKEQWLCNVRFTTVRANINLSQVTVNARTGDFNPTSLAHVINTSTINRLVVNTCLDKAAGRKSTLVFCVNLAHVRELTAAFREAGVDARYVYAGTPAAERANLIQEFKSGGFPVLLNCAVLTEGADIPNIDCVIVARPTRSKNVFAQMIGRGMRLSPQTGKEDCRIIDFVDSTNRVTGVVCTPTLFGLDPSEVVDDESTESLEERRGQKDGITQLNRLADTTDEIPEPTSVTYTDYDDPFCLVNQASGAPHIVKFSPHAWVGCGNDIYVLECMGKGYIRIEPVEKDGARHFAAVYVPPTMPIGTALSLKISPFQRGRRILTAEHLVDAIKGADTYAKLNVVRGPIALGMLRTAKWRKLPASESQKNFISKRWGKREVFHDSLNPEGKHKQTMAEKIASLTKGEAANIITRLKHGAQARYEKKSKEKRKLEQAMEKERVRRARETVSVGPLPSVA
ncbi:P-loop containing nucleoside triphosphate hydrolase protein [Panus rudis PR-1116 ss-1]|nr:P-loop containing nucleoside triphosphate hydrolase protein [Panus rudis PR-1116 ss-1]